MSGCVYALRPSNAPSQQALHIEAAEPAVYAIRIGEAQPQPVHPDGRVAFEVPRLQSGCAVYAFGLVKVDDHRSEDVAAIQVLREGRVVRRLSLNQISKLPTDAEGSPLLKMK